MTLCLPVKPEQLGPAKLQALDVRVRIQFSARSTAGCACTPGAGFCIAQAVHRRTIDNGSNPGAHLCSGFSVDRPRAFELGRTTFALSGQKEYLRKRYISPRATHA